MRRRKNSGMSLKFEFRLPATQERPAGIGGVAVSYLPGTADESYFARKPYGMKDD